MTAGTTVKRMRLPGRYLRVVRRANERIDPFVALATDLSDIRTDDLEVRQYQCTFRGGRVWRGRAAYDPVENKVYLDGDLFPLEVSQRACERAVVACVLETEPRPEVHS